MSADTLAEAYEAALVMDAPLSVRLAAFAQSMRALGTPYAAAYDRLVAQLVASKVGAGAPQAGDPMPPFLLPSEQGDLIGLADLIDRGPLVMSFNRGHWCEFCKLELSALAGIHAKAAGLGAKIVAIVPERLPFAGLAKSDLELPFPVLTDLNNGYALSLGLMMWVGSEVSAMYAEDGVDLETFNGDEGWCLPVPATFVVGHDGKVVARFVDPDFRRRMETDAILEALPSAAAKLPDAASRRPARA